MAFRVAANCLDGSVNSASFVFCSRYGEYSRSFGILEGLASGEPASAAAFSMSVHNTATSLFSIETSDNSTSTALAGGEATLETGFLEAWSLLMNHTANAVLLVYHDECLPELYRMQPTTVDHDAAFAMLLKRPDETGGCAELSLEWGTGGKNTETAGTVPDQALEIVRLLSQGDGSCSIDAGRLIWTWSIDSAAA